jgi:hypothetical protein
MNNKFQTQQRVLKLLPPTSNMCPVCAIAHPEDYPHDANSVYYKYYFHQQHQRFPTWRDAMVHCSPELQEVWCEHLESLGVDIDSTNTLEKESGHS